MIAHDTHKNNLLNQYRYCMTLGSNYKLMKYAVAPTYLKDDAQIIINVIDKLYPALLDMPFFSRCEYRMYDRTTNKMIVHQTKDELSQKHGKINGFLLKVYKCMFSQEFRHSFKNWRQNLRRYIRNPKVYNDAKYRESVPKELIAAELEKLIDAYPMYKRKMNIVETSYIPRDAHLALFLRALDKLGIKQLQ